MELEIFSLITLGMVLVAYLFMLREVIGMKKIINKMLKRSKKYMREVVSND
jgi:predicted PurR-regulated permease PerM